MEARSLDDPCQNCSATTFFRLDTSAREPGHCYSEAGLRELKISGFCEHCFDELADEDEFDQDFPEDNEYLLA